MKKIISITDLQRQSSQIVKALMETGEPVIITQRGRAAAVMLSAERYSIIKEDLNRLDELEMLHLIKLGLKDFEDGRILSQKEVRARMEKKHAAGGVSKRKSRYDSHARRLISIGQQQLLPALRA